MHIKFFYTMASEMLRSSSTWACSTLARCAALIDRDILNRHTTYSGCGEQAHKTHVFLRNFDNQDLVREQRPLRSKLPPAQALHNN